MWPLGHAAVGYLCYSLAAERGWVAPLSTGVLVALLVGTSFPDLVDKPLAWYLGVLPTGRSLGHSLFLLVPVSALAIAVASRFDRRALGVAFTIGALSHTVVDAVPALWLGADTANHLLWPLIPQEPYPEGAPTILALLRDSLTDPWFLLEFALAAAALLQWRRDGLPGVDWLRSVVVRDESASGS